jgi:hypothetical protein
VKYTIATPQVSLEGIWAAPGQVNSAKGDAQATCSTIGMRREASKDNHCNARDNDWPYFLDYHISPIAEYSPH